MSMLLVQTQMNNLNTTQIAIAYIIYEEALYSNARQLEPSKTTSLSQGGQVPSW